ncbi:2-methoxy-6-polyprenyl-1,4-benzoquinol methylase [Quillaja saponaria]|uniref:2-methoxy-6-polyprenyl-1,4-benzoquinol methylase n=1 Tax=Quillaja saponaria TaxID=32244 RepID=A0AAD7PTS6_QUISA|nr:2-methoxy-6-polyprenyl-1,4-benzoquinol methylase [Quillaja saponaria]
MDRKDTEMMEAEMETQQELPSNTSQNDVVRELLTLARQLINQGKPSQALEAVVVAVKTKGGDEAVFESLHRARELYKSRLQENAAVDQLASLFAECAIAEAQPIKPESSADNTAGPSFTPDTRENSILAETGRMKIVLDAFSDGSSFICLQCGGLVSNHRKDEHYAYWCCQL